MYYFGDTIFNSKDYVTFLSTSRDMYGVPLIAKFMIERACPQPSPPFRPTLALPHKWHLPQDSGSYSKNPTHETKALVT